MNRTHLEIKKQLSRRLSGSGAGLIVFYSICALVALLFILFQPDTLRVSKELAAANTDRTYLEALKFGGIFFIAFFILVELGILTLKGMHGRYDWGDTAASAGIYLINLFAAPFTGIYLYIVLKQAEAVALFQIGDGLLHFLAVLILFEGAYYWYHRLSHEIPFLWSIHHTHHSAQSLNLSIAFRLHTFGRLISPIVYLPLILIGFKPEYILTALFLSLVYQFFLHTEVVPKLGFIEQLGFNTPSKHRVHHGTNDYCIDKNYGGMLIIWDAIFGTYMEEGEKIRYGVTSGFYSYNPLKIMFKPQLEWILGRFRRERDQLTESDRQVLRELKHAD